MNKILLFAFSFTFFFCWGIYSSAQNLKVTNKRKHREYVFPDQVVDVSPNIRVHPSYGSQYNVPIARGLNPDILFASASVIYPSQLHSTEGVYVSTDGGNTWSGTDTCTAPVIANHNGNPSPGVGPDGRLYLSYYYNYYSSIDVSVSTDFGQTWPAGYPVQNNSTFSYNITAVDNLPGSLYFGRAYVAWADFSVVPAGIAVSYSSNGGANWSFHQDINEEPSAHHFRGFSSAVGSGGTVYIAYQNAANGAPQYGDYIGLAKSTDGGTTWTYNNNIYDCNGIYGSFPFTESTSVSLQDWPSMAIDNSGGSRNGWIYIVTPERSLAPAGYDPDIIMHVSTDEGATWSTGIRVNQDPLNNGQYQYTPAICVGQDGNVNIVYYDTRNATSIGSIPDSAQVYLSRSTDGGATFTDIPVSDHKFKPKSIVEFGAGEQGEYIGVVESNGTVLPYWCDDITGNYQAWIARVNFSSSCDVEKASSPNPADGSPGVDINLSRLSWSNGSGANTNELYFGTNPSSLDLVQSGSLSNSWTIDPAYLPLDYFTTYYWKVVEIGDTCSSDITFSFRTVHESSAGLDTLYPQFVPFWTGSTDGIGKGDGSISTIYPNVGWAVYDISNIPANAVINGIVFRGYVYFTNFPFWSATPMGTVNPVIGDAVSIKAQILGNYNLNTAYIFADKTINFTTGWHEYQLGNNAVPDFREAVNSSRGWFAMGFVDRDFSSTYAINFDGWSDPNPPCLILDYESVPVELLSFTAAVSESGVILNWQTATERNNKGFEVQRSGANGQSSGDGSDWQVIEFIPGNGTSTETHSYSFIDKNLKPGRYLYRLKQTDFDGKWEYSKVIEVDVNAPAVFALQQNYPNPFNPTTTIEYSIPADQHVKLIAYNLLGEKAATLVDGLQKAGQHQVNFNASELATGIYFYKLQAGNQTSVKKMILMK